MGLSSVLNTILILVNSIWSLFNILQWVTAFPLLHFPTLENCISFLFCPLSANYLNWGFGSHYFKLICCCSYSRLAFYRNKAAVLWAGLLSYLYTPLNRVFVTKFYLWKLISCRLKSEGTFLACDKDHACHISGSSETKQARCFLSSTCLGVWFSGMWWACSASKTCKRKFIASFWSGNFTSTSSSSVADGVAEQLFPFPTKNINSFLVSTAH